MTVTHTGVFATVEQLAEIQERALDIMHNTTLCSACRERAWGEVGELIRHAAINIGLRDTFYSIVPETGEFLVVREEWLGRA